MGAYQSTTTRNLCFDSGIRKAMDGGSFLIFNILFLVVLFRSLRSANNEVSGNHLWKRISSSKGGFFFSFSGISLLLVANGVFLFVFAHSIFHFVSLLEFQILEECFLFFLFFLSIFLTLFFTNPTHKYWRLFCFVFLFMMTFCFVVIRFAGITAFAFVSLSMLLCAEVFFLNRKYSQGKNVTFNIIFSFVSLTVFYFLESPFFSCDAHDFMFLSHVLWHLGLSFFFYSQMNILFYCGILEAGCTIEIHNHMVFFPTLRTFPSETK